MNRQQMISTLTLMGWEPVEDLNEDRLVGYSQFDLAHRGNSKHIYFDGRQLKFGRRFWHGSDTETYGPTSWENFSDTRLGEFCALIFRHEP